MAEPLSMLRKAAMAAPTATVCAGSGDMITGRPRSASTRATSAGRAAPPMSSTRSISSMCSPARCTQERTCRSELRMCQLRNRFVSAAGTTADTGCVAPGAMLRA